MNDRRRELLFRWHYRVLMISAIIVFVMAEGVAVTIILSSFDRLVGGYALEAAVAAVLHLVLGYRIGYASSRYVPRDFCTENALAHRFVHLSLTIAFLLMLSIDFARQASRSMALADGGVSVYLVLASSVLAVPLVLLPVIIGSSVGMLVRAP